MHFFGHEQKRQLNLFDVQFGSNWYLVKMAGDTFAVNYEDIQDCLSPAMGN